MGSTTFFSNACRVPSSFGQARARTPAVIEPPDTLEIRSSLGKKPVSCRRHVEPTWKSIARYPPPERHRAIPGRGFFVSSVELMNSTGEDAGISALLEGS